MVTKECVELDDVWVIEETLDFYLPDQLDKEFLVDIQFAYALDSTYEPRFLVPSDEDLAKFART